MKKILFIIESLQCGGAEKSLVTLLNNLDFTKFEVDLVFFLPNGAFENLVPAAVNKYHVNTFLGSSKMNILFSKALFWLYRKQNKNRKYHNAQLFWKAFGKKINQFDKTYDIAIAYNQGFATYFVADKVAATIKYAWVNTDYKKAGYNPIFDLPFYEKTEKIVTVSEASKESMMSAFGNDSITGKITVIEDVIDKKEIRQKSEEEINDLSYDGLKIVSVGRLHKAKGYDLAIKAAKILKDKNIRFKWYIVGEGEERPAMEELIDRYNLKEDVILLGFQANPYKYIRWSDMYVQTSVFEGFSITVREAKILRKLIVCTNFPSVQSAIDNELNGLIIEMNETAIAAGIEKLLNDTSLCTVIKANLELENTNSDASLSAVNELLLRRN